MDRKEIGALIKKHNLGQKVKDIFKDNWTRVPSVKLEEFIKQNVGGTQKAPDKQPDTQKPAPSASPSPATQAESPLEAACLTFLGLLKDSGQLDSLLAKL